MLDDTLAIKTALGVLSVSTRGQAGQPAVDPLPLYRNLRLVLTTLEQQDPDLAGKAGFNVSIVTANAATTALFGATEAVKPDGLIT